MNYFSHYIVLGEQTNPYTVLGSILPDLARDSKPQYDDLINRVKKNHHPPHYDLALGIMSHIESDKIFHDSDYFKKNTAEISKMLRENTTFSLNKYTYFLAHILLELVIDQLLIESYRNDLVMFYKKIRQTSDEEILSFIKKHLAQYDAELFIHQKDKFVQRAFLNNYSSTDTLVNVSYHIFDKVGITLLKPEEKWALKAIIDEEIRPFLSPSYKDMLSALKTELWEKSLYSYQA